MSGSSVSTVSFGMKTGLFLSYLCCAGNALCQPVITSQPQNQTVMEGGDVTLSIAVSSDTPPVYQWRRDAVDLPGQTDSALVFHNANTNDSGNYSVVITNNSGAVASRVAILSVNRADYCFGGYARVRFAPGYSLVYMPLVPGPFGPGTKSTVTNLIFVLNGTSIYKVDGNGFIANNYLYGWSDPAMNLVPGEAWYGRNPWPTNEDLVVLGNPQIGRLTNQYDAGFCLCGSIVPVNGGLSSSLGFSPEDGTRAFFYNNASGMFDIYERVAGAWNPFEPAVDISTGFWVWAPHSGKWTQSFDCEYFPDTTPYRIVQNSITSTTAEINFFTFHANTNLGRVYDLDGITPVEDGFYAQLYAGTNAAENALAPIGAPVSFLSGQGAGYVRSTNIRLPGLHGGQQVYLQLRAWEKVAGASYEAAVTNDSKTGKSAIFSVIGQAPLIGDFPGLPPPEANAFPSFSVIAPPPWPLTVTLIEVAGSDVHIRFNSRPRRHYQGQRTNASTDPWIWDAVPGAEDIPGVYGAIDFTDFGGASGSQRFYRIQEAP